MKQLESICPLFTCTYIPAHMNCDCGSNSQKYSFIIFTLWFTYGLFKQTGAAMFLILIFYNVKYLMVLFLRSGNCSPSATQHEMPP